MFVVDQTMGNFLRHLLLWAVIFVVTPSSGVAQRIVFDTTDHQEVAPLFTGHAQAQLDVSFAENAIADVTDGAVDVAVIGAEAIEQLAPHLGFLSDPFVIINQKHVAKLRLDAELTKDLGKPLSPFGLTLIGLVYLGQWGLVANHDHFEEADLKPDMVRHLRLAVERDLSEMTSARDLGMVPLPMERGHFAAAMKMAAVDAMVQSALVRGDTACVQWVPFLQKTTVGFLVVKTSRWKSLLIEQRESEMSEIQAMTETLEQVILNQERSVSQKNQEQGCKVIKADIGAFKDAMRQPAPDPEQPITWADHVYQAVIELGG